MKLTKRHYLFFLAALIFLGVGTVSDPAFATKISETDVRDSASSLENILQLSKEGRVLDVEIGIGASREEIINKYGTPDGKKTYKGRYFIYGV